MNVAPLTVAIRAYVDPTVAHGSPFTCAAIAAARYVEVFVTSTSVPPAPASDCEQATDAPVFSRGDRITLFAETAAVAFGSPAPALMSAASAVAISPEPSVESCTCVYVFEPIVIQCE